VERLIDQLNGIFRELGDDLLRILVAALEAVLILAVAALLVRWLRSRILSLTRHPRIDSSTANLFANLATIGVAIITGALVYAVLGGNVAVGATVLGAATVAVGLALQDILRGIVAGIYLLIERPFTIGERIRVKDAEGRVKAMELRVTTLRTDDGTEVHVPNATIFSEIVSNRGSVLAAVARVTIGSLPEVDDNLQGTIAAALSTVPGVRLPLKVTRYDIGPDGLTLVLDLSHEPGSEIGSAVMTALRRSFPDSPITVERANG
jgi:small conductance mechanosensitive channel